ncbi:DUF6438 domain-containing protein [Sphingomonas sp. ASY06-1R]|uniref:DUF6438 domain-containing protein n=1 Tax=Sphingomonas sp. ASY06-1R TaxID=3445771 RepID=UPI003FA1AAD9
MRAALPSSLALLAAFTLTACATAPRPGPSAPSGETISVAVGPCFGFCPVYTASVAPDGSVRFDGERHTAVLGARTRTVGTSGYRALARDLAPFRPADGSEATIACIAAVSDTSPYVVTWTNAAGRKTSASVQSGCPGGPGQLLVQRLRALPDRLGIADWAKQTTRPGASRG